MCRFVLYRGPEISLASLLTDPEHSLIQQSFHAREREEPLNGDGYGVAWFGSMAKQPIVFREVSPAWNSLNLQSLAPLTYGHCILAHVRAASPGLGVSQYNCHPFSSDGLCFMHNGLVADFPLVRRVMLAGLSDHRFQGVLGSTDSELLFALILDRLPAQPTLDDMADAVAAVVEEVEALLVKVGSRSPSMLNFCLSSAGESVVTRYATPGQDQCQTLYLNQGARYLCEDGQCRMTEPGTAGETVIVSSEPLNLDPGWVTVPPNHLLTIGADGIVGRRPLGSPRTL